MSHSHRRPMALLVCLALLACSLVSLSSAVCDTTPLSINVGSISTDAGSVTFDTTSSSFFTGRAWDFTSIVMSVKDPLMNCAAGATCTGVLAQGYNASGNQLYSWDFTVVGSVYIIKATKQGVGVFAAVDAYIQVCQLTCAAGKYVSALACASCTAGNYCPGGTTAGQSVCTSGNYCGSTELSAQTQCAVGSYCATVTTQVTCDSGKYCPIGSTAQVPCTAGSYCATPSTMVACTLGQFCPASSTTNPSCALGSYCPNTYTETPCSSGRYCPVGSTNNNNMCAAGSYCPTPSTQIACSSGQYCPPGSTVNNLCALGSYCPTVSTQTACTSGQYCPVGSTNNNNMCAAGSYCPAPSIQIACSSGQYCPPGSTVNNLCALGSYCPTVSTQTACTSGQYCPAGSSVSVRCPAGQYCNATGLSMPSGNCSAGYFCASGSIDMFGLSSTSSGTSIFNGYALSTIYDLNSTAFDFLGGIAFDANRGFLYVSDTTNCRVQRASLSGGSFLTLVGAETCTNSVLNYPAALALDRSSNYLFIADGRNYCIRSLDIQRGQLTTIAGTGAQGFLDGNSTDAMIGSITAMVTDSSMSRLFFADSMNNRIRQVVRSTGQVSTLAGSGASYAWNSNPLDGPGNSALLLAPLSLALDPSESYLLFGDNSARIRKYSFASGDVTTLTVTGTFATNPDSSIAFSAAALSLIFDSSGKSFLFFSQSYMMTPSYSLVQFNFTTGSSRNLLMSTPGSNASTPLSAFKDSACDAGCMNIYFTSGTQLGRISVNNACSPGSYCLEGTSSPVQCPVGSYCPAASSSSLVCSFGSYCQAGSSASNPCPGGYTCPNASTAIRCLAGTYCPVGSTSFLTCTTGSYCASGSSSQAQCSIGYYCPNSSTQLVCPAGQYCDVAGLTAPAGNCSAGYFCAAGSRNALGVGVNPVGVVTPFAGLGVSTFADGTGSTFNFPISVVMDPVRNFVYVSDNLNHRVRRVDMTSGAISVLAGTGSCYFSDGMGNASGLCYPVGLSVDALGNYLYIADSNNYRVRRVDLSSGFMSTVAGNGGYGYSDGNSSQAMFSSFSALVVDANSSRLFIADTNNYRIRSLKLSTGQVSTLAGNSMQGSNDGIGTQAMFGVILSIALDPTSSFLLFTDGYTKIRMLTLSTLAVTTLSSSGVFQSNPGSIYSMNFFSVIFDSSGLVYISHSSGIVQLSIASASFRSFALKSSSSTSFSFMSLRGVAFDANVTKMFAIDASVNLVYRIVLNGGCPAGTFCPEASSSPTQCPAGFYCAAISASPVACTAGTYCLAGSYSATTCPGGSYCTISTISQCPAGSYCPSGSTSTNSCNSSIGAYCAAGSSSQGICSFGSYCPNSFTQLTCPAGQYCNASGITTPSGSCSAGYYCAAGSRNSYGLTANNPGVVSTFVAANIGSFPDGSGINFNPRGMVMDPVRNYLYVSDNYRIRRVDIMNGAVSTLVGTGGCSFSDGVGTASGVCNPYGLAIDRSGTYLYVADTGNNRVRRVDLTSGNMSTVAGFGSSGFVDGNISQATFSTVQSIAVDADSTRVFVADTYNYRIRQVQTATGQVSTLAGSSMSGSSDGIGTQAMLYYPQTIALDPSGSFLLIWESMNARIRMLTLSTAAVTTLSSSLTFAANPGGYYYLYCTGMAFDSSGSVYFSQSNSIAQLTFGSSITYRTVSTTTSNSSSFSFSNLQSIAIDSTRATLYVGDSSASSVYRVTFNGVCPVGSYCPAGSSSPTQCPSGTYCAAASSAPTGCQSGMFCPAGSTGFTLCPSGLYCPSISNQSTCPAGSYCPTGSTSPSACNTTSGVYCGAGSSSQGICSLGSYCPNMTVQFLCPAGQYCSATGLTAPSGTCVAGYFCAIGSRSATGATANSSGFVSVLAGNSPFADGTGSTFSNPRGLALDPVRSVVYLADSSNHRIRRIDVSTGSVTTLVGTGSCGSLDGFGNMSSMCYPSGLSIDGSGSFLYVADTNNYRIRRVDLSSGYMSTVAGSGSWGYSDGIGTQATFMSVQGIVVDSSSSRVFVADSNNNRIRMVQISTGSVSTLAGSGSIGATDGVGTSTSFYFPIAIALDPTQTVLLVLDQMNNRIRMIVLSSLMVTTLSPSVTFVSNPSYNFVVIGNGILADSSGQGFFYTSSYSITQVTLGSGARNVPLINSNSTSFLFSSLQGIASDVSRQTFYVSDNTGLVYRVSFSSPCLAGSYCTAGTASPLQCPAGTYCPTGSSAPTVCSGFGSFCPAGTTGPALCASGFFCPNVTVALQCPAGSYCTSGLTGSLSCNSTSGVYCGAGSSSQSVCSLGYYCPSITTQIVCPAGQYCGSVGLTAPSGNCNLGVYCPAGSLNAFGSSVNSSGTAVIFAGAGVSTFVDGTGSSFAGPRALVVDPVRSVLYLSDSGYHRIRRISISNGSVSTLAGSGMCASADGTGNVSGLCYPTGLAIDAAGTYLYVADTNNYRIRRVDLSSGYMSSIAGIGSWGSMDGNNSQASFGSIQALAVDSSSSRVFIAESNYNRIRLLQLTTGQVSTLAGNSMSGSNDGIGTGAMFGSMLSLAIDPTSSYLLIGDSNSRIRMLTLSTTAVTTLSPSATFVSNPGNFYVLYCLGIAFDSSGFVYLTQSNALYQLSVGSASIRAVPLSYPNMTTFSFSYLQGVAYDSARMNLYVSDAGTSFVDRITFGSTCPAGMYCPLGSSPAQCPGGYYCPSGSVNPLACNSTSGSYCGAGSSSPGVCALGSYCPNVTVQLSCPAGQFCSSTGITAPQGTCSAGYYCPAGSRNSYGATSNATAVLSNFAGPGVGTFLDTPTAFNSPRAVAVDLTRNALYVPDQSSNRIRLVDMSNITVSTLIGSPSCAYADGVGTNAGLCNPTAAAMDAAGAYLYIADSNNYRIRRVDLSNRYSSTVAGSSMGWSDGIGTQARFGSVSSLALDSVSSRLFIADTGNYRIRQMQLSTGQVTTLAGNGNSGATDGVGTQASIVLPQAITLDPASSFLVFSDIPYSRIRMLTVSTLAVTTLTSSGTFASNPYNPLSVSNCYGIVIDSSSQSIYFAQLTYISQFTMGTGSMRIIAQSSISLPLTTILGMTSDATRSTFYISDGSTGMISRLQLGSPCPAGYYCPAGSSEPTSCPAGSYCDASSSAPTVCVDAGMFCPAASTGRNMCPGGMFCKNVTSSIQCPAGTYCPIGSTDPISCDSVAGAFCSAGSMFQGICPSGFFCPTVSSQVTCPAGLYCDSGATVPSGYCNAAHYCMAGSRNAYGATMNSTGSASVLAGAGAGSFVDGSGTSFNYTRGLVVDPIRSYVYVTEVTGHRIRRIDTVTGAVSNLVGNGLCSFADGVGSNAGLCGPTSLAINSTGSFLYVADTNNYRIRRVDLSSGYISTLAGNGTNGFTSGLGLQVLISTIQSIALDTNTARLFFAESSPSYRIRWLDLNTNIVSTLAGTRPGSFDAIGTAATFSNYQAIAVDPTGSYLMVSDGNSRIRMISLSNRVVQTLTATPAVYASNPSNYAVVSINGFHFDSSGQYVYYTQSNSVGMYVASSGVQVLLNVPNVSVSNYSFPSFQSLACDTTCLNLYVADANSNTISRISFRNVCPAAYYCPTGIATPTPCPPGSYCLAMSSVPTPCTAGSYCGITGLTAVTGPCSGGFFCQSGSSTATQFNCPPGSFCPVGSVNTTICPISTFCPNMSSTPLSCTVGGYCPTTALAAPVSCDPGSFCASTGLTTVSGACISGFYCASGAVNPYGGYGNVSAQPCTAGYYCPSRSSSPTQSLCPPGNYCPGGGVNITACPAGSYCVGNGSSVTAICPDGFYCPAKSAAPALCPIGSYCMLGFTNACANQQYCPGGNISAPLLCPNSKSWCDGTDRVVTCIDNSAFALNVPFSLSSAVIRSQTLALNSIGNSVRYCEFYQLSMVRKFSISASASSGIASSDEYVALEDATSSGFGLQPFAPSIANTNAAFSYVSNMTKVRLKYSFVANSASALVWVANATMFNLASDPTCVAVNVDSNVACAGASCSNCPAGRYQTSNSSGCALVYSPAQYCQSTRQYAVTLQTGLAVSYLSNMIDPVTANSAQPVYPVSQSSGNVPYQAGWSESWSFGIPPSYNGGGRINLSFLRFETRSSDTVTVCTNTLNCSNAEVLSGGNWSNVSSVVSSAGSSGSVVFYSQTSISVSFLVATTQSVGARGFIMGAFVEPPYPFALKPLVVSTPAVVTFVFSYTLEASTVIVNPSWLQSTLTYSFTTILPTAGYAGAWLTASANPTTGKLTLSSSAAVTAPAVTTGLSPILIVVSATNSYGFSASFNVSLSVIVAQVPDSTSIVTCSPTNFDMSPYNANVPAGTIVLSSSAALYCNITARLQGVNLQYVSVSSFNLQTVPANTGTITFANVGASTYAFNQGAQGVFQFIFNSPTSGTQVQIVLYSDNTMGQSTSVWAVSTADSASLLSCTPTFISLSQSNSTQTRTAQCTLQARQTLGDGSTQPAFTFYPFYVNRTAKSTLFGSPYCLTRDLCAMPDGDGANTTEFSAVTPSFSNVFTFSTIFPIYEGTIRIVAASSITTSVQVSSRLSDQTSTLQCGFRIVQANGTALLTVTDNATTVSGSSFIVCSVVFRFQGTLIPSGTLSQAAIIPSVPGVINATALPDGSAWQLVTSPNITLPLTLSLALYLSDVNQYSIQNYSLTIMSFGDTSSLLSCVGDNAFQAPAVSSLVFCSVSPRFKGRSVNVTTSSLTLQLQSLSSQSVLIELPDSTLTQRFNNSLSKLWSNVLKGGKDSVDRQFLFVLNVSSISESVKVTLVDLGGNTLNSTSFTLLSAADETSSLACPTFVAAGTPIACSVSASKAGSSVYTRYLSFQVSAADGYASGLCNGMMSLPFAVDGSQFPVTVNAPIQNGVMYINLCVVDFLSASGYRLATTSSVIVTRTSTSVPSAVISCRRPVMSAGSSIGCFWYGFTATNSIKTPHFVESTSVGLTATKQVTSATRAVAVSMVVSATSIPATDAVPRIPIQLGVSGPFATVTLADRQHSVSQIVNSVAAGKLLSWRAMSMSSSVSVDQTSFSLLSRATSYADYSALSATAQLTSTVSVQEAGVGSTTGTERFTSMSCSSQVCMAVCETGFLYSWGTNNAYQSLGRSTATSYDTRAIVTVDQNGWQHLLPFGADLYKTPAIVKAAVNVADHSTAVVVEDGNVLLIGSYLSAVGSLYVVPVGTFGASIVQLSPNIANVWSHSAFWLASTYAPVRLFAFRHWVPTSSLNSTELFVNGVNASASVVSGMLIADYRPNGKFWLQVAIVVYDDGSLCIGGTAMPLVATFGAAANAALIMSTSTSQSYLMALGLPRNTFALKVDGFYADSVGRVYLLSAAGRIYVMSLDKQSSAVFVSVDAVFLQPSLASVFFTDLSGDRVLVATDKSGGVYSQKYGQFSLQNTGFSGTSVAALFARGNVALAAIVPSAAVLAPPPRLNSLMSVDIEASSPFAMRPDVTLRSGSSQSIIAAAVAATTLPGSVLRLAAGAYPETMMTSSLNSLTLLADSGPGTVIIQCCGMPSCMQFSGDQVTLNGITIQCDQSVQCASTQPYVVPAGKQHTFINVTFQGCSITDVNSFGGAVSVLGSLAIQDSHFISNAAPVSGGAIACTTQQASLSISNTEFQGNSAPQSGGALYIQQCTADVSSSSFTSNNAPQGGAIFAQQATVSVATSTFSSNTASTNGGASMFRDSTASVSGSTWINNTATQSGGAVYIDSTVMAISGSNFSSNQAGSASCASCSGGAVFCQGQRVLNIVWSTFRQNSIGIAGQGGAVFMSSCLSNVSQSTLSLNSAGTGGALAVTSQANLVMDNLQFASNAAAQSGGAVYLTASTATCASTVFISNVATANGGALYASLLASFAVTSGVSFTSNTAGQGGGAVYWDGTIEPGTQGSVFSSNQAVYGPNRATQSRQLMWSRLANGLIVNSRQPIFDARTAIQLQLLDNYNQVVASDSTSSLTLQTVATSTLPVNLASLSRAGSSSPTATPSSGSITGTISCKFVSGNCSFGTTSANAFAVEVTPNFALPLKANVMLSSGSILSSPTILVPARGCLPGEFIDSTQCSPCPIGTFSNASQATSCSSCGDGFYADTTGSISCAVCPDGYSCIDRKSKTLCSSQAYRVAATANSGSCTLCPPSSSSDASRSFCRCDIGFYMVTDPTSTRTDKLLCQSCPLGADCRSAGTTIHNVVALRSYWPEKENTNTSFIHCINSGCSGGPTKCEPAYDGNLCTSCKRGYSRDSAYECTICPSSSSTFWQVLGVIAAVCVLCSCIIYFTLSNTQYNIKKEARLQKARQAALEERQQRRNEKLLALSRKRAQQKVAGDDATKTEAKVEFATDSEQPALRSMKTLPTTVQVVPEASDDPEIMQIINEYEAEAAETLKQEEAHQSVYPTFSILIKIFTSFLQFNSLAAAFNFQWPDAVMFIMHLQKEIAEIAANIISVDCAAYQTGSTFSLFYMKKIVIAFLPPIVVLIPLVLILMWGGIMKLLKRPISIESMKITLVTAVVVVLFFVLPTITQQAFGMLSCIKLGVSADDYYIVDNMDEQCWGSQHMFYLGLVCLPMILLYVFGIPLFSFRILWLSRFALHTAEVKQYFFFLYTGYESEYWFWEYTIVARKIVLVAISVFFQTNVQLQSYMALLLVVICLLMHVRYAPFLHDTSDVLEFISLFISFLTFFFGLFLFSPEMKDYARVVISVTIVALNLFFVAYSGYLILRAAIEYFRDRVAAARLEEQEQLAAAKALLGIDGKSEAHESKSAEAPVSSDVAVPVDQVVDISALNVDAGKLLVDEPHSAAEVEMMSMKSALPQSDQMVVNQLFVDQDSFRKNVEQPVHSDSVAVDANLAFEAVAGEIQESIRLADVESTIVPLASGRHSDNASVDLANLFGHDDNVVAESVEPHQMRSAPAEEVVAPHSAPSVDIDLTETDESNPAEVERNCHDDDVNHASEVQSGSNTDLAVVDRAAEHATEAKLVDVNPNPPTQPAAQTSDAVDSVASAPVRSKRPKVVDLRKAPPSDH